MEGQQTYEIAGSCHMSFITSHLIQEIYMFNLKNWTLDLQPEGFDTGQLLLHLVETQRVLQQSFLHCRTSCAV